MQRGFLERERERLKSISGYSQMHSLYDINDVDNSNAEAELPNVRRKIS